MSESLTRQSDIIPSRVLGEKITIIGAGAIGGWTTLALAKMGFCNLTVYDFDQVDTVNLNSQLYRLSDVGKNKVNALDGIVYEFTGAKITGHVARYEKERFNGIVISAVDSMQARRAIYQAHQSWPMTRVVIDARMGAESALLYCYRPKEKSECETYEKSLYSDSEAVQERCTAKATIYTANLLAGLVCKAVKDELTSETPLKSAQWDIRGNEFLGFNRKASHAS
jgi:molybdopterin/thiamine biosynthesis adenylyltransferase